MCYCEKCGKFFNRPRVSPREELEPGGFLKRPTYDLGVFISDGEYNSYTNFYYYKHNLLCPKCGKLYERMDSYNGNYWATELGLIASDSDVERFFNYGRSHPGSEAAYMERKYGYPGTTF